MEKVSREKLDVALNSLREQRTEDGKTTRIGRMACCYRPSVPPVCRWDRIPGEHICAKCEKTFGDPEKKEGTVRSRINEDRGDDTVEEWDIEEVLKAYRSCGKAGYDVELDMHCSECVKKYNLELAVFRFRAPGENDQVISFPVLRSGLLRRDKRSSGKHFRPWQYTIVADFLTKSVKKTAYRKDVWREWVRDIVETIYECGFNPWVHVGESIKGILGISLEEPK
jgi:hypothetical protein